MKLLMIHSEVINESKWTMETLSSELFCRYRKGREKSWEAGCKAIHRANTVRGGVFRRERFGKENLERFEALWRKRATTD